jgi:hypothetical protein
MKRAPFRSRTSAIAGFILCVLNACIAAGANSNIFTNVVGLWEEEGATVHAISLRKSDGTYRRKVLQLYDYAQPPIIYREEGHWRVAGRSYVFTADHISALRWKKDIGKQRKLRVLLSDTRLFKYLSTDGAVVEERRIGEASDAMFDKMQLGNKLKNQKGN